MKIRELQSRYQSAVARHDYIEKQLDDVCAKIHAEKAHLNGHAWTQHYQRKLWQWCAKEGCYGNLVCEMEIYPVPPSHDAHIAALPGFIYWKRMAFLGMRRDIWGVDVEHGPDGAKRIRAGNSWAAPDGVIAVLGDEVAPGTPHESEQLAERIRAKGFSCQWSYFRLPRRPGSGCKSALPDGYSPTGSYEEKMFDHEREFYLRKLQWKEKCLERARRRIYTIMYNRSGAVVKEKRNRQRPWSAPDTENTKAERSLDFFRLIEGGRVICQS